MVYENAFNYTGDEWTDASVAIIQAGGKLENNVMPHLGNNNPYFAYRNSDINFQRKYYIIRSVNSTSI